MSTPAPATRRLGATLRREERVTPLELFFDLVFVLAITQCTALMATTADTAGVARGLLVLAVLWWAWVGYSWLTSLKKAGPRLSLNICFQPIVTSTVKER